MTNEHADDLSRRDRARIVKTAVAPRPIAWVSTKNKSGADNLAPFSSYNYVTSADPVLVMNIGEKASGEPKDTVANIRETEEFVVNIVTEELAEQMDRTARSIPAGESEFDYADVERAESDLVSPPRVANAAVSMECELYDTKDVYEKVMVFGEVRCFHVDDRIKTEGEIDALKLATVGRLGGPYYTGTDPLDMERSN